MPACPSRRSDLLPFFDAGSDHRDIVFLHRHLTTATTPFGRLSMWPHGSMRLLKLPEVNLVLKDVQLTTTSGCHSPALREQLCSFFADHDLDVCDPTRTFVNSHVYTCRLLSLHSSKLLAAYTAICYEDATTKAPVLYVQYIAKGSTPPTIGSASVGDLLFEHMRSACMRCRPEALTVHILTQSVGYEYDPGPVLNRNNVGGIYWHNRLRITDRGLDYICGLAKAGEVSLKEDCIAMHRVFAAAPTAA